MRMKAQTFLIHGHDCGPFWEFPSWESPGAYPSLGMRLRAQRVTPRTYNSDGQSVDMKYRLGPVSRRTAPWFSSQLRLEVSTEKFAFDIPAGEPAFPREPRSTGTGVAGSNLQHRTLRAKPLIQTLSLAASAALLLFCWGIQAAHGEDIRVACSAEGGLSTSPTSVRNDLPHPDSASGCPQPAGFSTAEATSPVAEPQLIVIGFMGGRVKGGNLIHKEAQLAKALQERYPLRVFAGVFANHHSQDALQTVLHLLDRNRDGHLTAAEKSSARIVIYGHSWGASETVALARRLNALSIPVLLTIQVDSVQKQNENDAEIPPNVREAINFYQTEGLLHGRPQIEAADPTRTTILGNFESSYKNNPVPCTDFPWIARVFMKQHIEIENDPNVWEKIDALIQAKVS